MQKITLIVILYHSKHLLDRLMVNVYAKIKGLDEIILVDNSDDDLSEFASGNTKVVHPHNNIGYGAAINLGVEMAANENIVAINPDIDIERFDLDFSDPQLNFFILSGVPNGKKYFPKFPTLAFDSYRFALYNLTKLFAPLKKVFRTIKLAENDSYSPIDWIPGSLIISNKKTFKVLNGFDEDFFLFYEEVDLCKRAHYQGITVLISTLISFSTFVEKSSNVDVSSIKLAADIISFQKYHNKYSGKLAVNIIISLLKFWSFIIYTGCGFIGLIVDNKKIDNKMKQYKIYGTNLQNLF